MNYNYLVIEGCIGAGKTCFSKRLAEDYNAKIIYEQFADNSFLPKFYEDPQRYAFPLEMSFLTDRYNQLKNKLTQTDLFSQYTIADYFIDKCLIFSKNNLNKDEYSLYLKIFDIINSFIPKPDLIVYLYKDVDLLLKNIKKRGRDYEQNIDYKYLDDIQKGYLDYFKLLSNIPIVIIDTNKLDFVSFEEDYQYLKTVINKKYENGIHFLAESDPMLFQEKSE
ncbi:MAG: deoxynucleoside kinase [Bacteroidales bacterium]|nr:deoxynucleoside kinase [Bacteroidales bacterium]MDY0216841.1 deoxynucleoside kinase [Bacteroidales bacterium]